MMHSLGSHQVQLHQMKMLMQEATDIEHKGAQTRVTMIQIYGHIALTRETFVSANICEKKSVNIIYIAVTYIYVAQFLGLQGDANIQSFIYATLGNVGYYYCCYCYALVMKDVVDFYPE
ncbi:MAG: hypothetical protein EZS28_034558, partial [Streblomastix strix]